MLDSCPCSRGTGACISGDNGGISVIVKVQILSQVGQQLRVQFIVAVTICCWTTPTPLEAVKVTLSLVFTKAIEALNASSHLFGVGVGRMGLLFSLGEHKASTGIVCAICAALPEPFVKALTLPVVKVFA